MRLDNTLLDINTLLNELHKENQHDKSGTKTPIRPLEILQRKIKQNYFNNRDMSIDAALIKINSSVFDDFPRLQYVLKEIFSGHDNIQIPEKLRDWEPTVSFETLNTHYGYFHEDLSPLYHHLAIACRKMTSIIERQANDDAMAYKLMVIFYDPDQTQEQNFHLISAKFDALITKNQDRTIATPYHDAFVTVLSSLSKFKDIKDLVSWKKFIVREGFNAINIFAQVAHFRPAFTNMKEAQVYLLNQTYPRAEENPELAKLCKSMMISNDGFESGLHETQTGWPKKEFDSLPIVDVADSTGQFFWVKLPPQDMRAMYLGNLIPGCCQFINGDSRQCVKDGIYLENNGFYVLLKAKKDNSDKQRIIHHQINAKDYEIVAQSYAWKSQNGNLCLDSIEWYPARVSIETIQELMLKFSEKVFEAHPNIKHITAGARGQTPQDIYPACTINETMKQGFWYGDSEEQFTIASNISNNELDALNERLKPYPKYFRDTVQYLAPYFQDIDRIPGALIDVNYDILSTLCQKIPCINVPPTLCSNDFKKISFEEYQQMDEFEQSKVSTFCKIFNSTHERALKNWLPTIPSEELSIISLTNTSYSISFLIDLIMRKPSEQRLESIIAQYKKGHSLLFKAIDSSDKESFKMIFELIPIEQRSNAIEGQSILFSAISSPELFIWILERIPTQQYLILLSEKDENGLTLLSKAIHDLELFKKIFESIPGQERFKALQNTFILNKHILYYAIFNHELLIIILERLLPEQRISVLRKELNFIPFLEIAAKDLALLQAINPFYSPEEFLEAIIKKDENGHSLFYNHSYFDMPNYKSSCDTSSPELFKNILELVPPQHRLEIAREINLRGYSLLSSNYNKREPLQSILELIPEDQRLEAIQVEINNFHSTLNINIRCSLIYHNIENPEILKMILELIPEHQRLEAIQSKDGNGNSVLSTAIYDHELLKMILKLIPEHQRLDAVQKKDSDENSVLSEAIDFLEIMLTPSQCLDSFKYMFEIIPPEQRLNILYKEKKGYILFYPHYVDTILKLLPEDIAMIFDIRKDEWETNFDEVIASALSIEQFIKNMQELAPTESIMAFVRAIIKNDDIRSAKEALLRKDSSKIFFKHHNEAIENFIEKLDPFWQSRIQPNNPLESSQPKQR